MAEHSAPPTAAMLSKLIEHSRGLHLGVVLGDAWAQLSGGTTPTVQGGVVSQLLLATSEGLIRSLERMGQGLDPAIPHETVQALRRWAWQQGIDDVEEGRDNCPGLLWHVNVLGERRGSAPATVRALVGGPLAVHGPGHQSLGAHAAVRPLPFALMAAVYGPDRLVLAAENASITHGHPLASASARVAAAMA